MTITGSGFLNLLGLLLLALKLTGVIDLPWWVVLSPFALNAAIVVFGMWMAWIIIRERNRKGRQ